MPAARGPWHLFYSCGQSWQQQALLLSLPFVLSGTDVPLLKFKFYLRDQGICLRRPLLSSSWPQARMTEHLLGQTHILAPKQKRGKVNRNCIFSPGSIVLLCAFYYYCPCVFYYLEQGSKAKRINLERFYAFSLQFVSSTVLIKLAFETLIFQGIFFCHISQSQRSFYFYFFIF